MTAIEQLRERLNQLPEDQREAMAGQLLKELEAKLEAERERDAETEQALLLEPVPFERIKHLLGVVEGPNDLSTNPKYMEGFGQSSLR